LDKVAKLKKFWNDCNKAEFHALGNYKQVKLGKCLPPFGPKSVFSFAI
jgi:hypothetical protein